MFAIYTLCKSSFPTRESRVFMRNRGINLNTVFISAIKTDRGIIKVGIYSTSEIKKTLGGGYK